MQLYVELCRTRLSTVVPAAAELSDGGFLSGRLQRTRARRSNTSDGVVGGQAAANQVAREQGARPAETSAAMDRHTRSVVYRVFYCVHSALQLIGRWRGEVRHGKVELRHAIARHALRRMCTLVQIHDETYALVCEYLQRPVSTRKPTGGKVVCVQPGDILQSGKYPDLPRQPGDSADSDHAGCGPHSIGRTFVGCPRSRLIVRPSAASGDARRQATALESWLPASGRSRR